MDAVSLPQKIIDIYHWLGVMGVHNGRGLHSYPKADLLDRLEQLEAYFCNPSPLVDSSMSAQIREASAQIRRAAQCTDGSTIALRGQHINAVLHPLEYVVNSASKVGDLADQYRMLADSFDDARQLEKKPEHLGRSIIRSELQAGALFLHALCVNALPQLSASRNDIGAIAGCYSTGNARAAAECRQLGAWRLSALPWLRQERKLEFKGRAGEAGFFKEKRTPDGKLIGKDGKPLEPIIERDSKGRLIRAWLPGEPATESDNFDSADWLARLRLIAEDNASACRAFAGLFRKPQDKCSNRKTRARVRRKRAKRTEPTIDMIKAHELWKAGSDFRSIGKTLGISHETARKWAKQASGFLKSHRSVRTSALPTDRRGQIHVGDDAD